MSELPESWVRAPLGALIAEIVGGGTPSKVIPENFVGDIPFMTVKDMHGRFIADTQDHISESALAQSASTLVPADTLIVASRMSLGKICRPKIPVAINQDLKALFLREEINKTYVEYVWRANESAIKARGTGTTVKGIRLDDIRGLEVAVAPSAEQTRIADQLDTLLARIQACNDRLDAIPALLKRFRQAVLDAAASGDLIEDELASAPLVELGSVLAEPMRNGKSVRDGGGLPVLRLTALKHSRIDLREAKTGDWTDVRDVQRFLIRNGDYLVSRGNGSKELVGRGGIVIGCDSDIAFPDTMIRIRPNTSRLLPDYLKFMWGAPAIRRQIEVAAKTTAGIWKVSQPDLASVMIPLPSLKRQAASVKRVQALMDLAGYIERRHAASTRHARRLTPLTLAKAFRGELVLQDPTDEPARALLAKLIATSSDTAVEPLRKRPKFTGERPTMSKFDKDTIKAAILSLQADRFSFDELREHVSADYEQLKAALFELLEEPIPVVRQVFDEKAKAMQLVRVRS